MRWNSWPTVDTGAGNSVVGMRDDHRPIATRGKIATKGKLIVD
jgi:hypothetical protein